MSAWQEPPLATVAALDAAICAVAERIAKEAADISADDLQAMGQCAWNLAAGRENLSPRPAPPITVTVPR